MDKVVFLKEIKAFTEAVTKDLLMPTAQQKGSDAPNYRAAEVHMMRLPDPQAAEKKAPYIIHQIISSQDVQPEGKKVSSSCTLRSIFCVYCKNDEEGSLMLLNLMERLRIALMKQVVIGNQFRLDLESKIECLVYPDNTHPYFIGEMATDWVMPAVQREVKVL